jgi:hypothetical protein
MRILQPTLTTALLFSLAACATVNHNPPEAPVVDGTCIISYSMAANDGLSAHLGTKTFHIQQNLITWNPAGSLKLAPNWGLLELRQSPTAIEINLDGVVVTTVPQ